MYSAVVGKPFEAQKKCRQGAVRLKNDQCFSIPKENALVKSIFPAENAMLLEHERYHALGLWNTNENPTAPHENSRMPSM